MTTEEKEAMFQKAWDLYWHQETTKEGQKKQWDIMFNRVYEACLNIGKTKCYNIKVSDLDGKCLDAALDVMSKIKEGVRPKKLSSFCYLYTIGKIWSKKEIRWDRSKDLDLFVNNKYFSFDYSSNEIITNKQGE
jgi:hypothetical protein